jgi:cell division protein FtsB
MLKLNTVLTALALVLMTLLGFLGKAIWDDVATIKSTTTTQAAQVQTISRELDDHETRIRQAEKDVTILQQVQREERNVARSPKMGGNNNQ